MSRNYRMIIAAVSLVIAGLTFRCKPDAGGSTNAILSDRDPLQPKPAVTTTITGRVVDEFGNAIGRADVIVYGETTRTNADGTFHIPDIQVPGNRFVIQSHKIGYFSGVRALIPEPRGVTAATIVLMRSPATHIFQASTGSSLALGQGIELLIPGNVLMSKSGKPYSGPVKVSVRHIEPARANFASLVPGGDMMARRKDQITAVLEGYAVLRVQISTLGDEKLTLLPGTGTMLWDISSSGLPGVAPPVMPIWIFDPDKSIWLENQSAVKQDSRYVAELTHTEFSILLQI